MFFHIALGKFSWLFFSFVVLPTDGACLPSVLSIQALVS
jgi:hypothetical protein